MYYIKLLLIIIAGALVYVGSRLLLGDEEMRKEFLDSTVPPRKAIIKLLVMIGLAFVVFVVFSWIKGPIGFLAP